MIELHLVIHNDKLIVHGAVVCVPSPELYELTDKHADKEVDEEVMLTEDDIYMIMRMLGADYKGSFQSIFSSNLNCNKGLIKWNEQWVPFLDALIQLSTLSKDFEGIPRPKFVRRMKINVSEQERANFEMRGEHKCLVAQVHDVYGVIRCGGVEIRDITYTETLMEKATQNITETTKFLPFHPTKEVDIKSAIEMNLQIICDNCSFKNIKTRVTDIIRKELNCIDEVANKTFVINGKTGSIFNFTDEILNTVEDIIATNVVIVENFLQPSAENKDIENFISNETFIISIEDKIPHLKSSLKNRFDILSCMSDGKKIVMLMKNKTKQNTVYVPIKYDDNFSWVNNVIKKLDNKKFIVLVSEKQNNGGILGLVKNLKAGGHNISAVIIDDAHAPKFDPNLEYYKEQLEKNMTFNILKKGQWGSYVYKAIEAPVKTKQLTLKTKTEVNKNKQLLKGKPKIENASRLNIEISYSGLSIDCCNNKEDGNGNSKIGIDFSGINEKGDKVMGLVGDGSLSTSVGADPALLWPVPPHWTLEDAATVPAAYVQAYYCLKIRSNISRGNSVLILDGASGVGLALTSLCLSRGCDVILVVKNELQKNITISYHPQLNENNVIVSEDDSFFGDAVTIRQGKGFDFVINFESSIIREVATKCVGNFGSFLDFNKNDMIENKGLGMAYLCNDHTYRNVDVMNIFRSEFSQDRKVLQTFISEGIASGIIKPLPRVVYSLQQVHRALTLLSAHDHVGKAVVQVNRDVIESDSRLTYSPEDVILVVCDNEGFGLALGDQLIDRGARKLFIHLKTEPRGYHHAKIRAWNERGVSVQLCSEDLQAKERTRALIKKTIEMGRVGALFIVLDLNESASELEFVSDFRAQAMTVVNLDAATRGSDLSQFVVVSHLKNEGALSVAERVCEERSAMGRASLVVRHDSLVQHEDDALKINDLKPRTITNLINAVELGLNSKQTNILTINIEQENQADKKEGKKGIEVFIQHVDSEEYSVTAEEIVELRPSLVNDNLEADWNSNEPYIILLPGFEGRTQMLEPVAETLKTRAVSVKFGPDLEGDSIKDIACYTRQKLKVRFGNHENGKFYILGYSFGVNVALELAALLENEGHVGVVFCVDGGPEAMRTIIDNIFNTIPQDNLDNHVINHLENLFSQTDSEDKKYNDTIVSKNEIYAKCQSQQYKKLVIESLLKKLSITHNYKTNLKLKSKIVLMKSFIYKSIKTLEYDYGLSKYTEQQVKVFTLPCDHQTALSDSRISNIINMFVNIEKNLRD